MPPPTKSADRGRSIIEKMTVGGETSSAYVFHDNDGKPVMFFSANGVPCLYVYDGTGNPVAITTSFQTTAVALKYDPYGAETRTDGGPDGGAWTGSPYTFGTGIKNRTDGEIKFGQRWYDPATGGWTQQDVLNAPLDPKNANRYAYAAGDPINNQDASGKDILGDIVGYIAGVAVGVTCSAAATLATSGAAEYGCGVLGAATAAATTDLYDNENY